LRRKVLVITALCLFVGAGAAFAATQSNNYKGTGFSFSGGAGSAKKPAPVGFKETLKATNNDSSKAAAVLTDINVKIYGLKSQAKFFPTCSASKMVALKSDSFCPKKSKFATGLVNSLLGNPTLAKSNRTKCNPNLDVFNANGKGKLWFFFTTHSASQCAGLTTGATAPYPGFVSQQGKYQLTRVHLPPDVSTKVANIPNFYGSLIKETLNWFKVTTKVHGKTVGDNMSVGCLHGKRPWSVQFIATTNGHNQQKTTVKGSAKC
jgi:hypothetical protein